MDLSKIALANLAKAYGLQYQECRGIAEKLQAQTEYYGETLSLVDMDEIANALSSVELLRIILIDELDPYLKTNSILLPEIYHDYIANGSIFRWTDELLHIAKITYDAYLLGIATVEKEAAIKYLHENGYSLVNEVQGLNKQFVQKIIDQGNNNQQFAAVTTGTTGTDNSLDAGEPISRELWESREPKIIVNNMRSAKMPEDAIAYVLKFGCTKSNTDIGRIMYPDLSDRSWRGRVKELLDNPTKNWKLE